MPGIAAIDDRRRWYNATMTKFRGRYRVQSTRLAGWDYTSPGYYFITICTRDRIMFIGDVVDGAMALSPIGATVVEEWQKLHRSAPMWRSTSGS
jgi:hypothetical protein